MLRCLRLAYKHIITDLSEQTGSMQPGRELQLQRLRVLFVICLLLIAPIHGGDRSRIAKPFEYGPQPSPYAFVDNPCPAGTEYRGTYCDRKSRQWGRGYHHLCYELLRDKATAPVDAGESQAALKQRLMANHQDHSSPRGAGHILHDSPGSLHARDQISDDAQTNDDDYNDSNNDDDNDDSNIGGDDDDHDGNGDGNSQHGFGRQSPSPPGKRKRCSRGIMKRWRIVRLTARCPWRYMCLGHEPDASVRWDFDVVSWSTGRRPIVRPTRPADDGDPAAAAAEHAQDRWHPNTRIDMAKPPQLPRIDCVHTDFLPRRYGGETAEKRSNAPQSEVAHVRERKRSRRAPTRASSSGVQPPTVAASASAVGLAGAADAADVQPSASATILDPEDTPAADETLSVATADVPTLAPDFIEWSMQLQDWDCWFDALNSDHNFFP